MVAMGAHARSYGILFYGMYKQILTGEPFGNNPVSDTGLIIATGLVILLVVFIRTVRLETYVIAYRNR